MENINPAPKIPSVPKDLQILGILNLTTDSFSDGGRFLDPQAAASHIDRLAADADIIDVGPESSNPSGDDVGIAEQMNRLKSIHPTLEATGKLMSIDTYRPEVARYAAGLGYAMINDISGLTNPDMVAVLQDYPQTKAIMMFNRSLLQKPGDGSTHPKGQAHRASALATGQPVDVEAAALGFFSEKLEALAKLGLEPARVIVDPGMGFFLGPDATLSVAMLQAIPKLKKLTGQVCISVSRKSFLGSLTGRPTAERGPASLASELYAALQGANYVRTHDAAGLRDALTVWNHLSSV